MNRTNGYQHTLPEFFPKRSTDEQSGTTALWSWEPPTFAEFVRQIEHEFGDSVDLSSLPLTRADSNQALTPGSVRSLCEVLGVPPEDFGV